MCGITGIFYKSSEQSVNDGILRSMTDTLKHRGPDDSCYFSLGNIGLGFTRLSIIDIDGGQQPMFNEDKSLAMICNGEIFNYQELRQQLELKGHRFSSNCDVEVIIHLYEEYGSSFLEKINGQFAFAIYNKVSNQLFLARDHNGIAPLFYTITEDGTFLFGSEIKSILEYPGVQKKINLQGLDQLITFPGMVSPTTIFEGISSLKPGNFMLVKEGQVDVREYWDLNYPLENDINEMSEAACVEELTSILSDAVKCRMHADVPVGYYMSGGLDSSFIAALIHKNVPNKKHSSFSISFPQRDIDEKKYQRLMVDYLGSKHHEILFDAGEIEKRLKTVIFHSESPLKESYNTCSLHLSEAVRNNNIKVILSGEGADELFGGYVGYKFDAIGGRAFQGLSNYEATIEKDIREKVWGDPNFLYERHFNSFDETKLSFYSSELRDHYPTFSSLQGNLIDKKKIKGRNDFHKRSYLDFKLRLSDHLISDHGDRMAYANSIEVRYPFLDIRLLNFAQKIPASLKIKGLQEKYILKKSAAQYIPNDIISREKFSYVAPGSPLLMKENNELFQDILSYDTIKRQGFFDPEVIENLKRIYMSDDFNLNQTFETDLLFFVLTFGLFKEMFNLPNYH